MRTLPIRSKKQIQKDSDIAAQYIYYADIVGDKNKAVDYFIANKNKLSDAAFWEILRAAWIDCGNQNNYELFRALFNTNRPFKYYFMTSKDWECFNGLPNNLTVFRALSSKNDRGLSWSLSNDFVQQYAEKLNRPIVSKVIQKSDVFAYLNSRNEQEIILL